MSVGAESLIPARDTWDWELEAREQMASKLEAQNALRLICGALDLDLTSLGNGWSEAVPKILARVEIIVDEAERAFTERDRWRAHYERLAGSEAARNA